MYRYYKGCYVNSDAKCSAVANYATDLTLEIPEDYCNDPQRRIAMYVGWTEAMMRAVKEIPVAIHRVNDKMFNRICKGYKIVS